jgi:precorrin-2 methylase
MTSVSESEDRLYRTLVVADGVVSVIVEAQRAGAASQIVHRAQCAASPDVGETAERVWRLLAASDATASRALEQSQRTRRDEAVGPHFASRRSAAGAQIESRLAEGRIRERAYFLWERAGRPFGRAEEFWERARQEERC